MILPWTKLAVCSALALVFQTGRLTRAAAAELPTPATGASVDESRVQQTFYVDPANGEAADDDKHGAAEAPFATLRFACQIAAKAKDANQGVKLILANGTYREKAEIPGPPEGKKDPEAPLIIEAAERDQAIIDGADTEGWTPSTWQSEDGCWTHPWPFPHADAPKTASRGVKANAGPRRGDLLFVNETPLRQVEAEADLVPGSFHLAAPSSATGKRGTPGPSTVVVLPPDGAELGDGIVQIGVRPVGLRIVSRRNVVVRGLMFQHAANPALAPAGSGDMAGIAGLSLSACANVLVEDVLSQWNDGVGIHLQTCQDVTLRRVRTLHNGTVGVFAAQTKNLLAEDCESSFNDFRADWSGLPTIQGYGAAVFVQGGGMTWRRLHAVGNFGPALSLSGTNLTLEEAVVTDNLGNGLWVSGAGPALVRRCVVAGTKPSPKPGKNAGMDGGVILTGAQDVTLQSNVLAGNAAAQFALDEPLRGGKLRSGRHTYRHNVFYGFEADQLLCRTIEADGSKGMPIPDYRTLDPDENCYWNPASEEGFAFYKLTSSPAAAAFTVATREPGTMTFEKWREWWSARVNPPGTGAAPAKQPEAHSLWQDPGFVAPVEKDFRLKENSVVSGWDLPAEEAAGVQ